MLDLYITNRALRRIEFEHDDIEYASEVAEYFHKCFVDNIIKVKKSTISKARKLEVPDFDSAIEHVCAEENRLDAIITQNPSNYPGSTIPIWSIDDLREKLDVEGFSLSSRERTVRERHQACDEAFAQTLQENAIFVACAAGLRQYRLEKKYDAAFIINETYVRAKDAMDRGKSIGNWPGWIRLASRIIIQELSRAERKNVLPNEIENEIENFILNPNSDINWDNHKQGAIEQKQVQQAFSMLSQFEQDLLYLKIVQDLRWEQVKEILVRIGYESISLNSLSQKKRRALKKLKESYRTITVQA